MTKERNINHQKRQSMRITVFNGHITATEKKHIKALFSHKMTEGKVNTKSYSISESEGIYIAHIYEMEYSDFEQKRVMRKRKVSFSVK